MQDASKSVSHNQETTSQYSYPFTPASGHVNHLQRTQVLAGSSRSTVMNEVYFKMPRCCDVPRNSFHRNGLSQLGPLGSFSAREARFILSNSLQDAPNCGDTGMSQLLQQKIRNLQFTMMGQVFGHPDQVGRKALSTDVVKALIDHTQCIVHLWTVDPAALPAAGLALQFPIRVSSQ